MCLGGLGTKLDLIALNCIYVRFTGFILVNGDFGSLGEGRSISHSFYKYANFASKFHWSVVAKTTLPLQL